MEDSIDLKILWNVFRRHIIPIVAAAVIAAAAGFSASQFFIPKRYESSALLYVESTKTKGDTLNINDITAAQKTANTCQIIFQSNRMLSAVIFELDLPYSRNELRDMISVTPVNNTEVMEIKAECKNRKMAADIVNVLAELSKDEFKRVVKSGSIEIVEYAKPAEHHVFPNVALFTVGGFAIGAALLYIIFLLKEIFSVTVRSDDDLADIYDVPVFAEVMDFERPSESKYSYGGYDKSDSSGKRASKRRHTPGKRYLLDDDTPFVISEAYKAARTNIIFSLAACENKIISFTSAEPGEGKSTTCDNMSIAFADMGKRVLLIDCDMRKPTVHTAFNLGTANGLSSILGGFCSAETAVFKDVRPSLDVITSGPIPPNPTELLSSSAMTELLERAAEEYDIVMLDTPPVNIVTDSQLMNGIIGGHVLVVRENVTTHPAITEAFSKIDLASGKKLGMIKVCCTGEGKSGKRYGKYGHYSYSYEYRHKDGDSDDNVGDV